MKTITFLLLVLISLLPSMTNAAISYITSTTDKGNDDKSTLTVPASVLSGDVLITQVTFRNRNGSDGITPPAGWILVAPQDRDSDVFQAVYYRVATVADAGTDYEWDFDGNGSRRYILGMSIFRGVDATTPIADENSATGGVFWGSLTAPSVTTSNSNSMLVALYTIEAGNQSFSAGVGMAEAYDVEENNNNNGISSMVAWELFPGISATGSRVATASTDFDDGIGHLIALNEGASGPVVNSLITSCAALNTLVINFSSDLENVSAENVTNYSLTNAALNSITISSAVLSASNQVTLTTSTNLNDLTPYDLVINNVENLLGFPIAANTTESFLLRCDSNCITDNFVGPGPLSDSWSVGNSSGSFGDPLIAEDGRLRLTDSSNSVATFATLLNQFPGAENRIEIEFDYYGYDGNGADGIAINVSDASIAPVAGAAGGSLGYAQKTGVNGFSGGWLGVGIDEYGNFSNPTEGRVGGSGRITDSVSLRGSGSGTSGYPYLTGTSSLSPGIDQSGSSPNPGHRYKVVIDHTASGNTALVSIERDTGSGYSIIIPEFDVFVANPSQAVVPDNWVVSFTGSTGGSTNIHEIGDLKVCAAQPIQTFSQVDHYDISHTSPGLTCEASEIIITAHDVNHDPINVLSDTNISLTTLPTVSGIVTSPATILTGTASTSIYLQQTAALANIDIDVTDGTFTDDEGSSEDPRISFLNTAFRFYANGSNTDTIPINHQISAKQSDVLPNTQDLTLRAVQTNTDTRACEAALTGTQSVGIGYVCKNPSTCSARQLSFRELPVVDFAGVNVSGTDDGAGLTYTNVDLVFDAAGSAPFTFNFPDAGQIELHASLTVVEALPDPAFTLIGASNEFVVRPFAFELGFSGNFSALNANGSRFVKAGENFPMTVRAVNWHSADDADNDGIIDIGADLSTNDTSLNFGQEINTSAQTLITNHTLKLPATIHTGNLTSTPISTSANSGFFTAGITDDDPVIELSWDEVGIIDIDVSLNNYLTATGANILGRFANLGRFYPDHFEMTQNSTGNSCGAFSYMGQSGINIDYKLQAHKLNGGLTQNYQGAFAKATMNLVAENNNDGGGYQGRLVNSSAAVNWVDGEFDYTFSGLFTRLVLPNGPFHLLQVGAILTDNDGGIASINNLDMNIGAGSDCEAPAFADCNAKLIDTLDVRFGQLQLNNVFGPETSLLNMEVQTEYFDSTNFILNTDDNCTNLVVTDPPLTPNTWTDNLDPVDTDPNLTLNITAGTGGVGLIQHDAAGIGNEGSVIYEYDTVNFLPWLNTENDGDGDYADNPFGKVTFGQFRGNDRMIYWREIVR